MSKSRKLKGLIVKPRLQFAMAAYLVGGGVALVALLTAAVLNSIRHTIIQMEAVYAIDASVMDLLQTSITSSVWTICSVLMGLSGLIFFIWLRFSHRILGPTVAFERHIDELCRGNYQSRVRLRKKDEMIEMQTALNRLAEELQARHPSTQPREA